MSSKEEVLQTLLTAARGENVALTEANKLLAAQVAGPVVEPVVESIGNEREFHELAMDYRGANAFTAAPAAYKRLCDYIDSRAAKVSARASDAPSEPSELPICRDDGRCQYAIDHGAEGMGHCPAGKCCMPDDGNVSLETACRNLIAYLDKNPPMGDSLLCVRQIRTAIASSQPTDGEVRNG